MSKALQWAIARILDITAGDFFGSIILKFESGKLVRLEHQRNEKPPEQEK